MKKTRKEWIAEMMLMRRQPNPDTPEKRARAMEMTLRYYEIWHWLDGEGPEPDPDWKPEHPPKDEAERQRDIEEYVERISKRWLAQEAILEQDPDDPFYTGAGAPGVQRTTNGEG